MNNNLIGKKFNNLMVVEKVYINNKSWWKCKCDCGTVKDVGARALKTGMSASCGCLQKERVSEALTDDLMGKRFGYLTVIARSGSHCSSKSRKSNFNAVWTCKCDCGETVNVLGFSFKSLLSLILFYLMMKMLFQLH